MKMIGRFAVVLLIGVLASCGRGPRTPLELFKLHIADTIPGSVKNIAGTEKSGTGLAGHWAVVACDIDPGDAVYLVNRLGYPKYAPEDNLAEGKLIGSWRDLKFSPGEIYLK